MFRYIALFLCLSLTSAHASCRHALVLALDISGSVSHSEYRLQLDGIADALESEEVRNVLFYDTERPIALSVFEWSGSSDQRIVLNWQDIRSEQQLADITQHLRTYSGKRSSLHTAIGSALAFGKALLDQRPDCWRWTIDVSGDGKNNLGQTPVEHFKAGGFKDITVNGLAVSVEDDKYDSNTVQYHRRDLMQYFEQSVITGPASFVELARGYDDFKRAMTAKLVRELAPALLSGLEVDGPSKS